jgi:predicted dehydrogenase
MAQSVRFGIITEAKGNHLDGYLKGLPTCQGVEAVAAADPSGECFEKVRKLPGSLGAGFRGFGDHKEMLREFKPNVVLVTVEAHRAPERIRAALEAGSHVLTEKPGCVRIADFQALARTAEQRKLNLMLAMANRMASPVQKARALVAAGTIGKLYSAELFLVADHTRVTRPQWQASWMAKRDLAGGGFLIFLGLHYIDLVQFVSGSRVRQVTGFIGNVGSQPIETEDAVVSSLLFDQGAVATLHGGYYLDRGYHNRATLWGSDGWLKLDLNTERPLEWYSTAAGAPKGVQQFTDTKNDDVYSALLQSAIDGARGTAQPIITTRESLSVLEVVFAIYQAAATGRAQMVA